MRPGPVRAKRVILIPRQRFANPLQTLENAEKTQVSAAVGTKFDTTAKDPELARVVAAWPGLPEATRRAMVALIG